MTSDESVMHLKPHARDYTPPCGCRLERAPLPMLVTLRPCGGHAGMSYEIEVHEEDGFANVFAADRGAWIAVSKAALILQKEPKP